MTKWASLMRHVSISNASSHICQPFCVIEWNFAKIRLTEAAVKIWFGYIEDEDIYLHSHIKVECLIYSITNTFNYKNIQTTAQLKYPSKSLYQKYILQFSSSWLTYACQLSYSDTQLFFPKAHLLTTCFCWKYFRHFSAHSFSYRIFPIFFLMFIK